MESTTDNLERHWNSISAPTRTAFFCALVVSFIAHITALTNHLFKHKSVMGVLVNTHSIFGVEQGKWFNLHTGLLAHGNIITPATVLTVGSLFLAISVALTVSATLRGCF